MRVVGKSFWLFAFLALAALALALCAAARRSECQSISDDAAAESALPEAASAKPAASWTSRSMRRRARAHARLLHGARMRSASRAIGKLDRAARLRRLRQMERARGMRLPKEINSRAARRSIRQRRSISPSDTIHCTCTRTNSKQLSQSNKSFGEKWVASKRAGNEAEQLIGSTRHDSSLGVQEKSSQRVTKDDWRLGLGKLVANLQRVREDTNSTQAKNAQHSNSQQTQFDSRKNLSAEDALRASEKLIASIGSTGKSVLDGAKSTFSGQLNSETARAGEQTSQAGGLKHSGGNSDSSEPQEEQSSTDKQAEGATASFGKPIEVQGSAEPLGQATNVGASGSVARSKEENKSQGNNEDGESSTGKQVGGSVAMSLGSTAPSGQFGVGVGRAGGNKTGDQVLVGRDATKATEDEADRASEDETKADEQKEEPQEGQEANSVQAESSATESTANFGASAQFSPEIEDTTEVSVKDEARSGGLSLQSQSGTGEASSQREKGDASSEEAKLQEPFSASLGGTMNFGLPLVQAKAQVGNSRTAGKAEEQQSADAKAGKAEKAPKCSQAKRELTDKLGKIKSLLKELKDKLKGYPEEEANLSPEIESCLGEIEAAKDSDGKQLFEKAKKLGIELMKFSEKRDVKKLEKHLSPGALPKSFRHVVFKYGSACVN